MRQVGEQRRRLNIDIGGGLIAPRHAGVAARGAGREVNLQSESKCGGAQRPCELRCRRAPQSTR